MQKDSVYTDKILDEKARRLFANERKIKRLDGWFLIREISEEYESAHPFIPAALRKARALLRVCERIPLSLDENAVFAGTQRDAFAKSYALINPNFKVSTFNGYCDPAAVFRDIEPNEEFTEERIDKVRRLSERSEYVRRLKKVYEEAENDTREAAYFVEQVTGHLVPDFRPALRRGTHALREEAENAANECADAEKKSVFEAMDIALSCAEVLAKRYAELARRQQKTADGQRREELALLIRTLEKVPARGAENLFEALQSFILLWQVMCMEQAPNPFAFSVGNADRIFEPFRAVGKHHRVEHRFPIEIRVQSESIAVARRFAFLARKVSVQIVADGNEVFPSPIVGKALVRFGIDARRLQNFRIVIGDDGIHRAGHDVALVFIRAHVEKRIVIIRFQIERARLFRRLVVRFQADDAVFAHEIVIKDRVGVKQVGNVARSDRAADGLRIFRIRNGAAVEFDLHVGEHFLKSGL